MALTTERPTTLRLLGFLALALGALAIGVGCVLTWATAGLTAAGAGALDEVFKGIDTVEGKVMLAAVVMILFGILAMRFAPQSYTKRGIAILLMLTGLVVAGLAAGILLRLHSRFGGLDTLAQRLAKATGRPLSEVQAAIAKLVHVVAGPGLYVVIAGGILVAIGGALSIMWAKREEAALNGRDPGVADLPDPAVGDGAG